MNIFDHYSNRYERTREEEYSLQEYLDLCKQDRLAYASAAERSDGSTGSLVPRRASNATSAAGSMPISRPGHRA